MKMNKAYQKGLLTKIKNLKEELKVTQDSQCKYIDDYYQLEQEFILLKKQLERLK